MRYGGGRIVIKLATLHCLFWILEPERSFKTLRTPWDMIFAFFEHFQQVL